MRTVALQPLQLGLGPGSLVKTNFMYYPFATRNRSCIASWAAVLCLVFYSIAYFPGLVWGETDSDYAQHYRRQGMEAQERGDLRKALFYYSRAAGYLYDDPTIQNDLGLVYEQLGKLDEAEASYRAALERDSRYLPAYSNLGLLLKKRGRYELSAMYLKRRIELGGVSDPWMMNAQEELEDLYRRAPYLKNRRTLDSAAELERQIAEDRSRSRSAKAHMKKVGYELSMKRGLEAFRTADYPLAMLSFEEALGFSPDSSEARHALGRAKRQARKARIADSLQASAWENRGRFVNRYLDTAEEELAPVEEVRQ